MSQRLRKFEATLGAKLYETPGGHVRLTQAGERALDMATGLFDDVARFEASLGSEEESGNVTVYSNDIAMRYLLLDLADKFKRSHPLARLKLRARAIEPGLKAVVDGTADFAIFPRVETPPYDLTFSLIDSYRPQLTLRNGHPLSRVASTTFDQLLTSETLRRYPLVVTEEQVRSGSVEHALARLELPFEIGLEVGTLDTLKAFVANGDGLGLVSGLCIDASDQERLEVVPVPARYGAQTSYGVYLHNDKHLTQPMKTLLSLLGIEGPQ